jgi:hypothetical protein
LRELRSWPDYQKEGILIVAGWGKTIAATQEAEVTVTSTQLAMILGGVDPAGTRVRRRFRKSA